MSETLQTKNLNDVIWLRVFAILSLVAWHSYCSYICWGLAHSPMDVYYKLFFKLIAPIANMPLFTFLSGYLFCYLFVYCGKYKVFKKFLKNKVRRLLIPYLVLGFIINMTQINRMSPIDLFWGTPNHMWYCLMLFYCFIICWFVENKIGKWLNYILMVASFAFVLFNGGQYLQKSPMGLFMPAYFYCFFYLGYCVFKNKDTILRIVSKCFPLLLVLFAISIYYSVGGHMLGVSAVLFILMMVWGVNKIKSEPPEWIKTISNYSFGIFVFHQWIIWNVTRFSPVAGIMSDHYILFPIVLFIFVFIISFTLTHFLLKTKIGRFFLA